MQFHLNQEIVLLPEAKTKSLFEWYLYEAANQDSKVSEKQIPWDWSFNFVADEITISRAVETDSFFRSDPLDKPKKIENEDFIGVKLRPETNPHRRSTVFSMLGTDRNIEDIHLIIYPSKNEVETCSAWGSVSNTAEVDFQNITTNDVLQFHIFLNQGRFLHLVDGLTKGEMNLLEFRVSHADGFYSPWSPGVSTDRVKVLCAGDEQPVIDQQNIGTLPPRLGRVDAWRVSLVRKISIPKINEIEPSEDQIEDEATDMLPLPLQSPAQNFDFKPQWRISIALWLIVALLVIIAFKN